MTLSINRIGDTLTEVSGSVSLADHKALFMYGCRLVSEGIAVNDGDYYDEKDHAYRSAKHVQKVFCDDVRGGVQLTIPSPSGEEPFVVVLKPVKTFADGPQLQTLGEYLRELSTFVGRERMGMVGLKVLREWRLEA